MWPLAFPTTVLLLQKAEKQRALCRQNTVNDEIKMFVGLSLPRGCAGSFIRGAYLVFAHPLPPFLSSAVPVRLDG